MYTAQNVDFCINGLGKILPSIFFAIAIAIAIGIGWLAGYRMYVCMYCTYCTCNKQPWLAIVPPFYTCINHPPMKYM